ncbi:hypothetical protein D3C74_410680 [compost metagenome]
MHEHIECAVRFEEKEEDKTDSYPIQQIGEEQYAFEEVFASDFETQNRGKVERQAHLHKRSCEVVQTDNKYFEVFRITEDACIVLKPNIIESFAVSIPIGETVFEHVDDR